jgi:acetyl-CoA synthetase
VKKAAAKKIAVKKKPAAKKPVVKAVKKAVKKVAKKTAITKSAAKKSVAKKPVAKLKRVSKKKPAAKQATARKAAPSVKNPAPKVAKAKAGGKAPEINSLLQENRLFQPPKEFQARAHIKSMAEYHQLVEEAQKDPDKYWAKQAENLTWSKKWDKVLEWKPPFAKWFTGGKINLTVNCLDRHLYRRSEKPAIIWEGENGEQRTLTYQALHTEVNRVGNVLKKLGVTVGDRVAIYMPMIPEAAVAMLACARIGATHSIVFGGFSAEALRDRINDAQAKLVITADGGYRGGKIVKLKDAVDEAVAECPSVEKVLVFKRTGHAIQWNEERDVLAADMIAGVDDDCPPAELDSEHPLFILYTSGTTGKPKGVVHTTAGYLLWSQLTTKWIFDLKDSDIYWCTADIGWVTGHSYVVYGPLANGATTVMYEGGPMYPNPDRLWDNIERHKVSIFYTAPTAIRAFIKAGDKWPLAHNLNSLRLLGSVGEPINPEAWMWYHRMIGQEKCPIVDTWWQTETGATMISPLPGATPTTPGSATLPLPGIEADVVDKTGKPVGVNQGGFLVIKRPWPSMLRTIYGDPQRYEDSYWKTIPGMYFAGDGARRDSNGYFWVMGRVDDVINVAGHRLGTAEIESALVSHPTMVAEAAVVGRPDDLKGTAIVAFVIPKGRSAADANADPAAKEQLRQHVAKEIGAIAKPDDIRFTDALPKTRSGKIMRRLLRNLASGELLGDMTTLEDEKVLEVLRTQESDEE